MKEKYIFRFVVGDWSNDGHNQSQDFIVETSHSEEIIHKAYEDAIKACGVDLEELCSNFEDSIIHSWDVEKLEQFGISFENFDEPNDDGDYYCSPENFAYLFFELIKLQLGNEFKYKFIKNEIPYLNGYWHKTFNKSFGYGCF